jgi:hypothetical protein
MPKGHKEVKHMKMCVTKLGKKIGSPKINIGNGCKELKTIKELKVGDHVVFTLVVTSLEDIFKSTIRFATNLYL